MMLLMLVMIVFGTRQISLAETSAFNFPDFSISQLKKLSLQGNASAVDNSLELLPKSQDWNRTAPTQGKVFFHDPIRMLHSANKSALSWRSNFTFSMLPANISQPGKRGADGLVFAMVADPNVTGDIGGSFGLFSGGIALTPTLAVEFDTWGNKYQFLDVRNDNHVGIDINNVTSVTYRNVSEIGLELNGGRQITAWIEYFRSSHELEIRLSETSVRPPEPFIKYHVDLSLILMEKMWIGFSASTYTAYQFHTLHNWYLNTEFDEGGVDNRPEGLGEVPNRVANAMNSRRRGWSTKLIAAVAGGISICSALLLILLFALGFRVIRRGGAVAAEAPIFKDGIDFSSINQDQGNLKVIMVDSPHSFTYKQLSEATGGFSEKTKLGGGGFGCVFRGLLQATSREVAVKRLSHDSKQGEREFMTEVNIINRLRHRNLVQLLGWCQDEKRNELLLVYELVPFGSLDKLLFRRHNSDQPVPVLSWSQRYKILKGIASALEYLHEGSLEQVIHRDVKCSNVMIDGDYNAKLGDFGLARVMNHAPHTTRPAGSLGYIAPETYQTGKATTKSDVYSFGAIMLEVACGKKAMDTSSWGVSEDGFLVDWVWSLFSDLTIPDRILGAADKRLGKEYDATEMTRVLQIGLLCSNPDQDARPSMRQVVQMLAGEAPLPPVPRTKPVPVYSST